MNTNYVIRMTRAALIALLFWLCSRYPMPGEAHQNPSTPVPDASMKITTNMVRELNSDASALFELAGERFAMNEKRGRRWIMTLHDAVKGFEVLKYTDGKMTVLSLPVMAPDDELGLRRYVNNYNSYNVRWADLKVKGGRYEEPREIYTVLLHFDPDGSLAEGLRLRLSYLKKIEKGEDVDENVERLMGLSTDLAPSFLIGMDDAPPVRVNNLLDVIR